MCRFYNFSVAALQRPVGGSRSARSVRPRRRSERALYRIHRAERRPWWFSGDGSGRFDLSKQDRGTCYLGESALGAFVEVFRTGTAIPESEVAARRISELHVAEPIELADCTVAAARGYGVTGAIHTQPDYGVTRAWADAFARAGLGGIRYRVSHDPSLRELGVALYGTAGERDLPVAATRAIGAELIRAARERYALVVAPTPG